MITSHMHVKAPGFPRHPKDDDLVNDFMSGFSLADAIKSELMERGYDGLQLIDEDWGWLVVAFNRASNTELRVMVSSELCLNLGDARHQAARFLASFFTSTPSLNLIPSMTFGN